MWNKEKDIEYKKLKRSGYNREQLKDYFGEDIYDSKYFQKSEKLSFLKDYKSYNLNEIRISPEKTKYSISKEKSLSYNKNDYIINFSVKNINYVLILFYTNFNNIQSYELLFTTQQQYDDYKKEIKNILSLPGKHFTIEEQIILKNIVEKETNIGDVINLMKSISYILLDIYNEYKNINIFSIRKTENPVKINLYRNIIEHSFKTIKEKEINDIFYYFL